jgi:hypothetical protein
MRRIPGRAAFAAIIGVLLASGFTVIAGTPASATPLDSTMTVTAPTSVVYGQPITVTATVKGPSGDATPTGTVDIFGGTAANDGGCIVTLAKGTGSCTTPNADSGPTQPVNPSDPVTAAYSGDDNYAGSVYGAVAYTAPTIDIKPAKTTLTLTSSSNPVAAGTAVTFTATLKVTSPGTGTPDGSVLFTANGGPIDGCPSTPTSNNGASLTWTCQPDTSADPDAASGSIGATFSGSSSYAGSTATPLQQVVTTPTTTVLASASPNPVNPGETVTFYGTVTGPSGTPTGSVTISSVGVVLCTFDVPGASSCKTGPPPAGFDTVTASYVSTSGPATTASATFTLTVSPSTSPVVGITATPDGQGYWVARADGAVSAFGDAVDLGSMYGKPLNAPIVGMAATADGQGYWLVASDGGIFTFGDAAFYGSAGNLHLNKPIVGMTATPDGRGYYFVASDGGVFSYGDGQFQGSMGGFRLNQPVVGMAVDAATGGYWLVAADGGVFSFNAPFYGSTGNIVLNQPISGMEAASNGAGYRFVAADGGVFCFDQPFSGSAIGRTPSTNPIVGIAASGSAGYWMVAQNGQVFSYGVGNDGSAT